jgi:hypothetical protein
MHYVTHRSHWMQKHMFGVTSPDVVLWNLHWSNSSMKKIVDVLRPGHTGIHYVTCRSHHMQKHKFSVTCAGTLFVESVPIPPEHEK